MATNRGYVYQSGDKDRIIDYLERCEKRMLEQFAEIRSITESASRYFADELYEDGYASLDHILALCDAYLDKRSDKQRMQDNIDELKEQVREWEVMKTELKKLTEKEEQLRSDIGESLS